MAEFRKTIGVGRGAAMMLNIVLGAGLLSIPGLALAEAGDAALLIWLACAVAVVPLLFVFGVIGREHPDAGGIATIMRKGMGEAGYVPAILLFLGAVALGLPSIALIGGSYAATFTGASPEFCALVLTGGAALANLMSPERAGRLNAALASVVVFFILAIAVVSWIAVKPDLGSIHVVPQAMPKIGVLTGTFMIIFFAFTGWEVAATLSGEFRNPRREFPLAMGLSFAVALVLYLALAMLVAAYGSGAATKAPFTVILGSAYGKWGEIPVAIVATVLIFANLTAAIWAVSRMVCTAAGNGILPRKLSTIRDAGVPLNAVLATGTTLFTVGLAAFYGWVELDGLLSLAGQNFLILYAGAALALVRLTPKAGHRAIAVLSIALVCAVLTGRDAEYLAYPLILIVLGLLMALRRSHTLSRRLNKEPSF